MNFLMLLSILVLFGLAAWRTVGRTVKETKTTDRFNREQLTAETIYSFRPRRGLPFLAGAIFPLFVMLSFAQVDAGSVGVVKRFGSPVRQLVPGAHLVMPFADTVTRIAVQTRIVHPEEDAASRDLQIVHTEVKLAYQVDPQYATNILVDLKDEAETRIIN